MPKIYKLDERAAPRITGAEDRVYYDKIKPFFEGLKDMYSPIYPFNMAMNYDYLRRLMDERDLSTPIVEKGKAGPAIVVASGPSLDVAIPFLNEAREKQKAKIWCGPTQVWALHYQGVTPDYVVQYDPWYRRCPRKGCESLVYSEDDGKMLCMEKRHEMTPAERADILLRTYLHREAPEIPVQFMARPGVAKEPLRWPVFPKSGKLFMVDTNPIVGGAFSRDIAYAQFVSRCIENFANNSINIRLPVGTDAWIARLRGLGQLIYKGFPNPNKKGEFLKPPGRYEPPDVVTDLAIALFGPGNPLIKHPLQMAIPSMPSTSQACAALAWTYGHDPIYFVGYDLCQWKERRRHTPYYHDGTHKELLPSSPKGFRGESGFITDEIQLGEKMILLAYVSKKVKGVPVMPGYRPVEVVCEQTPGQLELLPRVGLEEFSKGRACRAKEVETAGRIKDVMQKREEAMI